MPEVTKPETAALPRKDVICEACGAANSLPTLGNGGNLTFQVGAPYEPFCKCGAPMPMHYMPGTFVFRDHHGAAIATVHANGRVEVAGDPNDAAKAFWTALAMYPRRLYDAIEKAVSVEDPEAQMAALAELREAWGAPDPRHP